MGEMRKKPSMDMKRRTLDTDLRRTLDMLRSPDTDLRRKQWSTGTVRRTLDTVRRTRDTVRRTLDTVRRTLDMVRRTLDMDMTTETTERLITMVTTNPLTRVTERSVVDTL